MQNMKTLKYLILIIFIIVISSECKAQTFNSTINKYYKQTQQEYNKFKKKRQKEYNKFKQNYLKEFSEFKNNYLKYLDRDIRSINLMTFDDKIHIIDLPLNLRPKKGESNSKKQLKLLNWEKYNIKKLEPSIFKEISKDPKKIISLLKDLKHLNFILKKTDKPLKKTIHTPRKPKRKEVSKNNIPHGFPTHYIRISSPFGWRKHPIYGRMKFHRGIDLAANKNTPIIASANGIITYAGYNDGYGIFVKINHLNGYKTGYAHMCRTIVKNNQKVKKGEVIGYVGSSGNSTGNHLHYEVYYKDQIIDPNKTF